MSGASCATCPNTQVLSFLATDRDFTSTRTTCLESMRFVKRLRLKKSSRPRVHENIRIAARYVAMIIVIVLMNALINIYGLPKQVHKRHVFKTSENEIRDIAIAALRANETTG